MLYPTELRAHTLKPTSGKYYARVRVEGKLIVESLKAEGKAIDKVESGARLCGGRGAPAAAPAQFQGAAAGLRHSRAP